MWLFDYLEQSLRPIASLGRTQEQEEYLRQLTIATSDTPHLSEMIAVPEPHFFDGEPEDPFMRQLMVSLDVVSLVVVPIAMVAKTLGIVALRKDFPAATLPEFIAYAKNNPGKINLGHAGIGSSNYLISKSFVQVAGIEVALVGYRGAAPGRTDAIGGQIDGVCDAAASVTHRRSTAS